MHLASLSRALSCTGSPVSTRCANSLFLFFRQTWRLSRAIYRIRVSFFLKSKWPFHGSSLTRPKTSLILSLQIQERRSGCQVSNENLFLARMLPLNVSSLRHMSHPTFISAYEAVKDGTIIKVGYIPPSNPSKNLPFSKARSHLLQGILNRPSRCHEQSCSCTCTTLILGNERL